MIIGMGESPIYKAESLLEEFKPYFKYIKKGQRLDEHKNPQDNNRLIGLIITPEELLQLIPQPNKLIHEGGNHLTSALLTTGILDKYSDGKLYEHYLKLYEKYLESEEYLNCLRRLLEEGNRACKDYAAKLKLNSIKEPEKEIEVKHVLIPLIHLARILLVFLRSCGEKVELKAKTIDILAELKAKKYLTEEFYSKYIELLNKLLVLRLEKQIESKSAEAKIKLKELDRIIKIDELHQLLNEVATLIDNQLAVRLRLKKASLAQLIGDSQARLFAQQPPVLPRGDSVVERATGRNIISVGDASSTVREASATGDITSVAGIEAPKHVFPKPPGGM
jgi:hypothetical protein